MDSTIVAYVSLFALGVFVGLAIAKYRPSSVPGVASKEPYLGPDMFVRPRIEEVKAADMIRRDPMRKRPGLATLRHQAEMESMKPVTEAEKRVAKNAEALS